MAGNGLGYSIFNCWLYLELIGAGSLAVMKFTLVQNGGWYIGNNYFLLPPSSFVIIGLLIWALRAWKTDQVEEPQFKIQSNSLEAEERRV